MEIMKLVDEVSNEYLKQIGDGEFQIIFNENKKVNVKVSNMKILKDVLILIGSNKTIGNWFGIGGKSKEKQFTDLIKNALTEHSENVANILNKLLNIDKTFDEHLEDYTARQFEILVLCLIKVNADSFLVRGFLEKLGTAQVDYKSLMVTILTMIFPQAVQNEKQKQQQSKK